MNHADLAVFTGNIFLAGALIVSKRGNHLLGLALTYFALAALVLITKS